jgi:hypothetical protein
MEIDRCHVSRWLHSVQKPDIEDGSSESVDVDAFNEVILFARY